eukprot:8347826-Alexandrium_andersonii.AAC.1
MSKTEVNSSPLPSPSLNWRSTRNMALNEGTAPRADKIPSWSGETPNYTHSSGCWPRVAGGRALSSSG